MVIILTNKPVFISTNRAEEGGLQSIVIHFIYLLKRKYTFWTVS